MKNKQIKKLAYLSYTKNTLDIKKVNKIANTLTRSELKEYIKAIKLLEKGGKIILLMPKITGKESLLKEIKRIYPAKKILIKEDKSLIAGIRVIDNDTIFDFNLKNTLQNLVSYVNE